MVGLPEERERLAWWVFALAVIGVFVFVLWSFVGTVVLGVFLYYGTRPLYRRLRTEFSSDHAADLTLLIVLVPVLALVGYTVLVGLDQLNMLMDAAPAVIQDAIPGPAEPTTETLENATETLGSQSGGGPVGQMLSTTVGVLGALTGGLAHLVLATLLAFTLLREDSRIAAWFHDQFGPPGSAANAYAEAVDEDLHTVFVGNVLTVFAVVLLGLVVYNGLDVLVGTLAPNTVRVPVPTLLALLTGLATLVPLVVGKIVYVPVGLYVTYVSVTEHGLFWFPAVFFVTCFVLLDLLPVAFLRPYIAGRSVHGGLMIFAYIGGTMLFGWYGLFLGPLLVVVAVQLARIVLPPLVHGEPVTGQVRTAESLGSDPPSIVESPATDGVADRVADDGDNSPPDETVADETTADETVDDERTTDGGKSDGRTDGEKSEERTDDGKADEVEEGDRPERSDEPHD